MYGYVYKITNKLTGKIYIGRHKAAKFDANYWGSGIIIKKLIATFGIENFDREVLVWAKNNAELNKLEIKYIADYKATNPKIGYNISTGGEAINAGRVKVSKNGKSKLVDEKFITIYTDAGWIPLTKEDKLAIRAAAQRRWRQNHKEQVRAAKKIWRHQHPERVSKNNKSQNNKIKWKEYHHKYYLNHKKSKLT